MARLDELGCNRFAVRVADLVAEMQGRGRGEALGRVLFEGGLSGDKRSTVRVADLAGEVLRRERGATLGRALLAGVLLGGDRAFAEALRDAVPWALLLSLEDRTEAEALLLGSAGLLASQTGRAVGHGYEEELEKAWGRLGSSPLVSASFVTLRVANHPARRLAGLARLLVRHRDLIHGGPPNLPDPSARELTRGWEVAADGYWRSFVAPGRPATRPPGALIGRSRAIELLTNAVLPWTLACAELDGDGAGAARVREAYAALPAPARYGRLAFLEEHLRRDGKRLSLTARRQQGLLALYKRECTQGGCGTCPLS